jgi:8-oxo-dGTP pyrophosphatase MutT (NUDIX family)
LAADRSVPPDLVERASAFLSGEHEAVAARGAATVVLLRDGSSGPEAYLLRRHLDMAFAAGMYAFPGGTVDLRDFDAAVAWAGPSVAAWADRLRCAEVEARAFICAAVRETFEESGVLLAGTSDDTVVADTTARDWEADRAALVDRTLSFTELLERRGLVLRTDLLAAWAHWITPEFEPRRYDTRFFVALLPTGQRTRDVSGEADRVVWMRPADAVACAESGQMQMLPPTSVTLAELAVYPTSRAALAAAGSRVITTIMPGVTGVGGRLVFTGVDDDPAVGGREAPGARRDVTAGCASADDAGTDD